MIHYILVGGSIAMQHVCHVPNKHNDEVHVNVLWRREHVQLRSLVPEHCVVFPSTLPLHYPLRENDCVACHYEWNEGAWCAMPLVYHAHQGLAII